MAYLTSYPTIIESGTNTFKVAACVGTNTDIVHETKEGVQYIAKTSSELIDTLVELAQTLINNDSSAKVVFNIAWEGGTYYAA